METLWASLLLSLSAGDASKNTISWTTHPRIFLLWRIGKSVRHSITFVEYLFWRTLLFELQGFSARSRHLYTELCVRANMLKSFDLLKTQLQVILSEIIVSFIVLQCVYCPSGAAPGPSVCIFFLLVPRGNSNCFLTDKNTTVGSGLLKQKTVP